MSVSNKIALDVTALLRARNPLLWVVTREEARVEGYLIEAAAAAGYKAWTWDCAAGVADLGGNRVTWGSTDPGEMLATILARSESSRERGVWIMRDLPAWLEGPIGMTTLRGLRNLARRLPGVSRENAQAVVVITPVATVPAELMGHATVIEWPLPDREEIAAILDAAVGALPEDMQKGANREREAAIDAAVGLSGEEAAACYARSLVQLRTIDPVLVSQEKRRVVARERVLEWIEPLEGGLNAVGGLNLLKGWLNTRALAYTPEARAYGLPAPRGALLVGISGCLTGDTIINVCRRQRVGGYKGIRLDALFYRFNDRHHEGSKLKLYEKSKRWDLSLSTKSHCYLEDRGYIGFNEIEGVIYSGIKEVYRLTTNCGNSITATADHEFLTTNGYVKLGDLNPGDELLAYQDGILINDNSTGRKFTKPLRQINNVGNHPFARRRIVSGLDYTAHPLSRLVVEADLNGLRLEEFLWALQGETENLNFLSQEMEVHHKDRNRDNNTLDNLKPMTKADHARLHTFDSGMHRSKYSPRIQTVVLIEPAGEMPTYDIQMKAPNHNFIANGLVVHNCGKSLTAKAIATAWGVPLLRVDLGALKSKYVGESEASLRRAFSVISTIGRCVVWFDELEKSLAGATQGAADGGVSADALGAILLWMQERKDSEAFVVATANDIQALPPELMRKGRFDETWFVNLPTRAERADIIIKALRAHHRTDVFTNPDELSGLVDVTEGFTGSEIAALVPDALFAAFADDGREINSDDLLTAAHTVVPLSKTASEKIESLRAWAAGRARAATSAEVIEIATVRGRALDL
jgi:hypothetical protein